MLSFEVCVQLPKPCIGEHRTRFSSALARLKGVAANGFCKGDRFERESVGVCLPPMVCTLVLLF